MLIKHSRAAVKNTSYFIRTLLLYVEKRKKEAAQIEKHGVKRFIFKCFPKYHFPLRITTRGCITEIVPVQESAIISVQQGPHLLSLTKAVFISSPSSFCRSSTLSDCGIKPQCRPGDLQKQPALVELQSDVWDSRHLPHNKAIMSFKPLSHRPPATHQIHHQAESWWPVYMALRCLLYCSSDVAHQWISLHTHTHTQNSHQRDL